MNEISFTKPILATGPRALDQQGGAADVTPRLGPAPILMRYLRLAHRWKWLIAGCIAASLAIGLIVTLLMTRQYTASSLIEIQREGARVVNVQGVEPETSPIDLEFYQTQYGLLKAETLARRVATSLRLYDSVPFFEMFGDGKHADQLKGGGGSGSAGTRQERIDAAARILLKHVAIDEERLSRLVYIRFTSPDPQLSARIVNTWSRQFIEASLARRFEATSYARVFLEGRLNQLRTKLQDSERALVNYASNQKIISVPANTQGGAAVERPLVAENLATANADLNAAIAARVAVESRLASRGGTTGEALSNQAISDLISKRSQLSSDRAKLLAQFRPDYPPVKALSDQIADIDRAISNEENRVRSTIAATYSAAAEREQTLRKRVSGLESDLLDLRRRTIQYNIFQREVDTNRQLYDALLQRYKEIGVAGGVGVNNISVVDPADVPLKPSSPRVLINLFLAGLFGSALGLGLALLLDQADDAISDPREVEEKLGLPLIGTIPRTGEPPIESLEDPKSALVDAYFSVRTRLAFTTDHGVPTTIAVTSTQPGEGKSVTSFALARMLGRTSGNALLIDADMRSPSQHEMIGVGNEAGLSNLLSGSDLAASFIRDLGQGVSFLSSGPTPPNAAELLSGPRWTQLLANLSSRFDYVVVDCPPVMGLADTPLIASHVEGCLFVVESHRTRASQAAVALSRLSSGTTRLVGVVLTKLDSKRAGFGYGYDYGYGYGEQDATAS